MSDDTSIYGVNDSGEAAMRVSTNVTSTEPTSIYGVNEEGKAAVRVMGVGGGGGDQHNLGWYATQAALETAHPTAEDGDWAIVGETDTVWVWDSDTTAWKDTDQKGQVESVNGQTGTVVLTASDVGAATTAQGAKADTAVQPGDLATVATTGQYSDLIGKPTIPDPTQVSTLPTAGADELGNIYQFVGTTDANYTNGYFYKCVSDGATPAVYSWTAVEVQAGGGLPSQTGNAGKFLTTDGTDASWSDKPLVNTESDYTSSNSNLVVKVDTTEFGKHGVVIENLEDRYASNTNYINALKTSGVVIGSNHRQNAIYNASVLIGNGNNDSNTSGSGTPIIIGNGLSAYGQSIVIAPNGSWAYGNASIAIGQNSHVGRGSAVSQRTDNAMMINLGGAIATNTDANTVKIANANGNFEMMSADGTIPTARLTKVNSTITLTAAGWSSNTQTVNVTGMTADGVVMVSPDPTDQSAYTSAGILCTAQASGTLTFTCDTVPSGDLSVNVVML